jgi:hypothetical protein
LNAARRSTDKWAGRFSAFFDWVDDRDADKHFFSLVILSGTIFITQWAMGFAERAERPGLEVAAIIAAVLTPYSALQAAALSFYFRARQ